MQQPSFPMRLARPIGWGAAAAMIAGAAMGAIVGVKVACAPGGWLLDFAGCAPGGAPVGALLMTPATRRDFQSSRQPPADTGGRA
jgi:hypothetical protein